jgi:hypothetical protein
MSRLPARLVEVLDYIALASAEQVRLHAAIDLRIEAMRVERESFKNLMIPRGRSRTSRRAKPTTLQKSSVSSGPGERGDRGQTPT